jgi:hypothetical protein
MDGLEVDQLYSTYKTEPSQDNLTRVVGALRPTIDYALGQRGLSGDPLMRAKSMSYAVDAITRYDPAAGASLPTFLSSQLQQLGREARQFRSPVYVPDRIRIESMQLNQAVQGFQDTHGREPDTLELADFTGTPVKRIETIRKYQVATPGEEAAGQTGTVMPDYEQEALEYVYSDSDHIDRRIMELKMGYAGHPVLPPAKVGESLRLTPSQLSRRSARLALRINKINQILNS